MSRLDVDKAADDFIRSMEWKNASEETKSLVIGNIRGFAKLIAGRLTTCIQCGDLNVGSPCERCGKPVCYDCARAIHKPGVPDEAEYVCRNCFLDSGTIRTCVVAIVQRTGSTDILFGRRMNGDSAHGKLVCPGGGVKYGETLTAAVVREVKEETGLQALTVMPLFVTQDFDGGEHRIRHVHWVLVAAGAEPHGESDLGDPKFYARQGIDSLDLSDFTRSNILPSIKGLHA